MSFNDTFAGWNADGMDDVYSCGDVKTLSTFSLSTSLSTILNRYLRTAVSKTLNSSLLVVLVLKYLITLINSQISISMF